MSKKPTYEELEKEIKKLSQETVERKTTEEAYRNIVESSPMGMHFYELQNDRLVFIGANPAADRLLGVDNQAYIGKTIEEAFPPLSQTKVPKMYRQAARQGIPWETEQVDYEDHQIIGAFEVRAFQISPNKMAAMFTDITNRKKIVKALKDSEESYRLIAENVADVIWTMDMNFRFTYISPSIFQLRGYTVEEAMQQSIEETVLPESLSKLMVLANQKLMLIESGDGEGWSPITFEAEQFCKDGTTIWSHNNARFLPGPNGEPVSILGVTHNITDRKRAEEVLRESEEKYKSLANNLNVGIYRNTVGPKGKFLEANPAIVEMFGFDSKEEFLQVKVSDLYKNPDDRKEFNAKLLKAGALRNEELQLQKKDGTSFIGSVSAVLMKDEKDEVQFYDGIVEDATARKQAEEALRESEEKHRKLVSNISDVIAILDKEGIITYKSSNITEQFGWSPDDLIGKHSLFTVHLDDQERIGKELTQILKKDRAKVRVEYKYICKDGSNRPVELTAVNMVNDPVINGVLCNYKDITERKYSEETLKQSEEKYRTMIERSNDMIWTLDTSGNFTFFNKQTEEVTGLKLKEWIGKSFVPLILEEDLPMIMDIFKKGLKGESAQYELRFRNQENEILTITVNTAPLLMDGAVSGIVSFGRDITRRKLAEEEKADLEAQLQKAQKMESIGTLAGGIAHDFNNILFPMFGYLEMMLEDVSEDSPLRDKLAEVFTGAMRARDLVLQILTFSRQTEHEKKPLKVQLVIKEALKLIHSSLPTTIVIHQDISNECKLVMADHTQIHQIAMNLITNAYHAMEETGGKLTITLKEVELAAKDLKDPAMIPGPHVCLSVADTGPGMDQGNIARIFDPYFTTKEEGKGTGLGLAVVHGIVKSHGGHISVYSEPGKGTEFKVHLPVIKKQKESAKVETDLLIQKGNEQILLVDDQDIIVQMEKQMLERLGYHVSARFSSVDALEAFRANPEKFDLVITDMTMPNMTGEQLAREIMKIRSNTPVILCTGFSEMMSKEKAESLGIKGFLMKPVVIKNLSKIIRDVLDNNK